MFKFIAISLLLGAVLGGDVLFQVNETEYQNSTLTKELGSSARLLLLDLLIPNYNNTSSYVVRNTRNLLIMKGHRTQQTLITEIKGIFVTAVPIPVRNTTLPVLVSGIGNQFEKSFKQKQLKKTF